MSIFDEFYVSFVRKKVIFKKTGKTMSLKKFKKKYAKELKDKDEDTQTIMQERV